MGILFMFFSFYTQLLAGSLVLNPLTADFLLTREEFNLTKKDNVYEKTFRMPYDFWNNNPYVIISFSFDFADDLANIRNVKDDDLTTLPIQNAKDFRYRLQYVWLPYDSVQQCGTRCHLTLEQKNKIIRLLESYHPNQYFKLKLIFIPLANPEEKQEEIIEFPLYSVLDKQDYPNGNQFNIGLMRANVKTWRKYYVKIEVLEDTILPKDIIPIVIISSSTRK